MSARCPPWCTPAGHVVSGAETIHRSASDDVRSHDGSVVSVALSRLDWTHPDGSVSEGDTHLVLSVDDDDIPLDPLSVRCAVSRLVPAEADPGA